MTRVAILISGGGSNMVRLVDAMAGEIPATPCLVLSNTPGARGLAKAAAMGVPTQVVDHRDFKGDRTTFETALTQKLDAAGTDVICLAGFMRVLTGEFTRRWPRMLNIHPSLLPKYPGLDTHARAIAAGDTEAGCTVHEVTETLDDGPILGQARVPILGSDTGPDLAARVLQMEHRLYPKVLAQSLTGGGAPIYLA